MIERVISMKIKTFYIKSLQQINRQIHGYSNIFDFHTSTWHCCLKQIKLVEILFFQMSWQAWTTLIYSLPCYCKISLSNLRRWIKVQQTTLQASAKKIFSFIKDVLLVLVIQFFNSYLTKMISYYFICWIIMFEYCF